MLLSIWGLPARDSGLLGHEGVWGAVALSVIGLRVKCRTAEALTRLRLGKGGGGLRLCISAALHAGFLVSKVAFGTCRSNMLKILDNCKINC